MFAELPTIFIPCQLEASTSAIKLHPLKAEPQSKVMSESKDVKDKEEEEEEEDDKMPCKRPKMTRANCRSSGLFVMSDEMKQIILMLEGKMLTVHRYLKELQGHTSTVKMFIVSQQADLEDLKAVMGI